MDYNVNNDAPFEIHMDDSTTFKIQQNKSQSSKTEQRATENISTNPATEDHTFALPVGIHGHESSQGEQELDPRCPLCLVLQKSVSDIQQQLKQTKPQLRK